MSDRARELDDRILASVRDWHQTGRAMGEDAFDGLARAICAHQLETVAPYARFAATKGIDRDRPPRSWTEIPAVPAAAFKDATLATFDVREAELEFHTSGTTAERAGKHFVERAAIYDASLLAGFDRFMLPERPRIRFLNLVPNPRIHHHSSLGYMIGHVSVLRGDGNSGWFLELGADGSFRVDIDGVRESLAGAIRDGIALCITGTAFALAGLCEAMAERGMRYACPPGTRIMETGGFKGRAREISREDLYARLTAALGVDDSAIVAEYGMTELLGQYYDSVASRTTTTRVKISPPWLRTLVIDADGNRCRDGDVGFLRHVDLANRSSVLAIQTEDLGYRSGDGIVLIGRDRSAPVRGCSLDAEDLLERA